MPQNFLSFGLAGLLLTAAALKALALEAPGEFSPWLAFTVIVFELLLASWLVSGVLPVYCWCASTLCFGAFATVSLIKVLRGEADCGCFGIVRTSPWVAFGIDATAIFLLLASFRQTQSAPALRRTSKGILATTVLACSAIVILAVERKSNAFSGERGGAPGLSVSEGYVYVDVYKWIHHPLPILKYLDSDKAAELQVGQSFVVFYRDDCGECEDLLRRMYRDGGSCIGAKDEEVVLVGVAAAKSGHGQGNSIGDRFRKAPLRDERNWIMRTPLVLRVVNARVEAVVPIAETH